MLKPRSILLDDAGTPIMSPAMRGRARNLCSFSFQNSRGLSASVLRFYHQVFKQPTSEHHRGKRKTSDSPVQKTALNENTLLPLYPVLQESDLTDQDPNLSHHPEQFLDHWKNIVDLEFKKDLKRSKSYQTISTTENIQQLQTQKQEASQATQNSLHFYTYYLLEQTLTVTDGVTAEIIANATKTLKDDIVTQEQNLEATLATESQLQNLLKRKEENNAAVETEGQEIINKLEGEKTRLIQKLSTAENQIKQVSETAEQLQKEIKVLADRLDKASTEKINLKKNLLDFTSKKKNIEKDLQELEDRLKKKVDMGVTHDDEDTSEKTFANSCKKNPKDDDIPATEQDDEDAKKVNRAFVSMLNNLYDTIAGKEERADHNQTIIEGKLLNKVKKMRDHRKSKILLQGLLPKYKAELYLRMPENTEDFDALCKQVFISEKILHTKEATDDKEMSAVIAGGSIHADPSDLGRGT
ncbi:hypothetical protein OUZ56_033787 [Daphnia magna]|uniref:Uncharacterized protein n=1 Tax=Daphnia magna TaxID=35525 RepID=A0ABR0BB38_9CRUS|nr:hypothetical protein OUZ56_033787 [Daphnia magna]